jgi:general secretion pathway protein K
VSVFSKHLSAFSNPHACFRVVEAFSRTLQQTRSGERVHIPKSEIRNSQSGSALIVALWVLIILSLLIGAFAFDMNVEAGITSYYRKRLKAQYLAYAGVEYAKVILSQESTKEEIVPEGEEEMNNFRKALEAGGPVSVIRELGAGSIEIKIKPETSKRDVNKMDDKHWEFLLDRTGVPAEEIDKLIDCFRDYTDPGDEHHVNGAESDDPFYEQRGYKCKNAPVDSVEELLRIKGFTPAIVFGGRSEEEGGEDLKGIADALTVWGTGDKVDALSASEKALSADPDLTADEIDDIVKAQVIEDNKLPESLQDFLAKAGIPGDFDKVLSWGKPAYVEVTSVGVVSGVRSTVLCTLEIQGEKASPVAWREGDLQ